MSSVATRSARTLDTGLVATLRSRWRLVSLLAVIVIWVLVWTFTRGDSTLAIQASDRTDIHGWFLRLTTSIEEANNVVTAALAALADAMDATLLFFQHLFTVPEFPRPLPQVGWLGALALASLATYAVAGWRPVLIVAASFLLFGMLGYYPDAMDLLIVTSVAVAVALLLGIPIGIWMGHSKVVSAIVTPILDVMQTMPSFVYLLPFSILFGIGPAVAALVTLVYAMPPAVRVTAYAIRAVSSTTIEATDSLGQSRWQRLRNVELPMAKRTIIVGVNQTTMAALSMATIAAYVDGPGLGQPVLEGLRRGQLGKAFVAGLAIVIMAIMLDRTTTAASIRAETAARSGRDRGRQRWVVLGVGAAVAAVAVYLSNGYSWANEFPAGLDIGTWIQLRVDDFSGWLRADFSSVTTSIQERFTLSFLNPVQDLIAGSPWFVAGAAICAIAWIAGGNRALGAAVICLTGLYFLDLWNNAMITLTAVLVATVVVMLLGIVVGVWMGRSKNVDRAVRPFLDAAQTLPPFVYLIPVLVLFGANRFTAMVAGVIYAAPVAIKLIADGVRGVSATTVEAAEAAGTSRLQMIWKVQLPMARGALLLAANQGLLYVLSMVVIGGMVGAGALGFDIVYGFRQSEFAGKGLAAGVSIVLIGIMLDRITTYSARRSSSAAPAGARAKNTTRKRFPLLSSSS
ncbi:MAG: ABC transporter permease subunit [Nocardioidaceae bacterium]|nr:ABC transporter permease subunit [Nocardioidaceae bacterium]